jgi:hypothetical protein
LWGAVFLLLVIRRAPWWSLLLLMGVAFLNHESALFIGVWMVARRHIAHRILAYVSAQASNRLRNLS